MPTLTFYLKHPDSDHDSAIYFLYTCADGRLKYYTGQSANKNTYPGKVNKGTRSVLSRITAAIEQAEVDYRVKGDRLTKGKLRGLLDELLHKRDTPNTDLFSAMEKVVEKMQSGEILTRRSKRYSAGTLKSFRLAVSILKKFNPRMKLHSITMDTYHEFIVWCQQQNFSTNYTGNMIKRWRIMGLLIGGNDVFLQFKQLIEETNDIYLDEAELKKIAAIKLPAREDLVRDWFLIGCYTGLRVSDLTRLSQKNIDRGYITIANEKTDTRVVIPVHKTVKAILKKYKGFPPAVTDVEINRIIKQVAKKAKINTDVLHTITKGGKREDSYLQKWEMVSTHSARRSFITNLLLQEVSETFIMKMTGIKSFATLKKYSKLSPEEAAKKMMGHRFFK